MLLDNQYHSIVLASYLLRTSLGETLGGLFLHLLYCVEMCVFVRVTRNDVDYERITDMIAVMSQCRCKCNSCMALHVAVCHSHGTNKRMCKQARAPRDGLATAAKDITKYENMSLYKEIYVSPICACSLQCPSAPPHLAVNENTHNLI